MTTFAQGWTPNPRAVKRFVATLPHPVFAAAAPDLLGAEKETLLYRALDRAMDAAGLGKWESRYQKFGSCVGQGCAHVCDVLAAVDAHVRNEPEEFKHLSSAGCCYAGGRVEVAEQSGRWEGSNGSWSAEFVRDWGVLHRIQYDEIDLRDESEDEEFGQLWTRRREGIPSVLETIAREHPVKDVSMVRSWDELIAAIQNGYPVTIASDVGFTMERDDDGFCKQRGSWSHQMSVVGVRFDRPGALIQNSWGDYLQGRGKYPADDQPPGSFWATRRDVERILRANDSWAFSGYVGFPKRIDEIDYMM